MTEVVDLPLDQIESGDNDRTVFDETALDELAHSIRANGLAQPITVRPIGFERYQVVCGDRRFRAHKRLVAEWQRFILVGEDKDTPCLISTVRCIVKPLTDEEAAAIMLLENTARADLDPIDEANAYAKRMLHYGWSAEQVARNAGKRIDVVQNRLLLLKLRDDLQIMVRKGQFSIGYATVLANAGLDRNRQMIALRHWKDNQKDQSIGAFTAICSELAAQQAQSSMFDDELMTQGVQTKQTFKWTPPPVPGKQNPPTDGSSLADIISHQIEFWMTAANQWAALQGCSTQRHLCLAAAEGLRSLLPIAPTHSTQCTPVTSPAGKKYAVYATA